LTNPSVLGTDGNYGGGPAARQLRADIGFAGSGYIPASVSLAAGAIPATDFFGNKRPDSGTCVDVGAVEFPVAATDGCVAATPTLTSISPSSRTRPPIGSTIYAETLTGTNLTGATAVNVSSTGMTCVITGTDDSTTRHCELQQSRLPPQGGRNVSVTTPGGTSNNVTFTVGTGPGADFDHSHVGNGRHRPRG